MKCPECNKEMSKLYNGKEPIIWKCSCGFDTIMSKEEKLRKMMTTISVDEETESALNELAYTAEQTGIVDFKLHDSFKELI